MVVAMVIILCKRAPTSKATRLYTNALVLGFPKYPNQLVCEVPLRDEVVLVFIHLYR